MSDDFVVRFGVNGRYIGRPYFENGALCFPVVTRDEAYVFERWTAFQMKKIYAHDDAKVYRVKS